MIACPFCAEDDFDLLGLKLHLERGWCEPYQKLNAPIRCMEPDCPYFGQALSGIMSCGCVNEPRPHNGGEQEQK